jgi:hypothetical protein
MEAPCACNRTGVAMRNPERTTAVRTRLAMDAVEE